jgi:crotonobetainyl-CoA:carnitine CoA-transferase CaiB-like acyl-CoA transferase
MIVEMGHPLGFTYKTIATGIKFSETPVSIDLLPPGLGGDTVEVLRLVGYGDEEIEQMIGEGVAHA